MKKIVIRALVVACLATFMTGCVEKEEVKETVKVETTVKKEVVQVEKAKNEVSEKVFTEFTKALEAKDVLKTKEFILDNIQNVTKEIADKMVVEYELLLKTNFNDLADKCNSDTYFMAINENMNEEYALNLEAIKDEKIKEEVMNIVDSGYTFEMLEGSYYLTIDYAMINNTFSQYLSENIKPYYELRKN